MALWDVEPVFSFTFDVDWASEAVMKYSHKRVVGNEFEVTYFNTHPSPFLDSLASSGRIRMLIHPNFLPGSSHGASAEEVMDYCKKLVPDADGFRTHRYYEVNDVIDQFARRGFKYYSNHCTRCETHLRPLWHRSGMLSLPIFFEDGAFLYAGSGLDFEKLRPRLEAPGLKIINLHPAHMALNTPDFAYMRRIKDNLPREEWATVSLDQVRHLENRGYGIRNVVQELVEFAIKGSHPILSLHDVYDAHVSGEPA
jgi:hypothetical protein